MSLFLCHWCLKLWKMTTNWMINLWDDKGLCIILLCVSNGFLKSLQQSAPCLRIHFRFVLRDCDNFYFCILSSCVIDFFTFYDLFIFIIRTIFFFCNLHCLFYFHATDVWIFLCDFYRSVKCVFLNPKTIIICIEVICVFKCERFSPCSMQFMFYVCKLSNL